MDKNKIKNTIGQLEKSISDAGKIMGEAEFQEYCDQAYSLISKWRIVLNEYFGE